MLTNSGHTIRGDGYIGGANLTLANGGLIYADADLGEDGIGTLQVQDLASFTNFGTIGARNGAKLFLNNPGDGKIANAGGTISAIGAGSVVNLKNVVIVGGTLLGQTGGTFTKENVTWDGTASRVTAANVDISANGSLHLKGSILHTGQIDFGDRSNLIIDADTTLTGGGKVVLYDAYVADGAIVAATAGVKLNNVANTLGGTGDSAPTRASS